MAPMSGVVQMVMNGEARCARQIVTISNSDGKITYIKPQYPVVRLLILMETLAIKRAVSLLIHLISVNTAFI